MAQRKPRKRHLAEAINKTGPVEKAFWNIVVICLLIFAFFMYFSK